MSKALHQCGQCGAVTESKLIGEIWGILDKEVATLKLRIDHLKASKDDAIQRLMLALTICKRQRDEFRDGYWMLTRPTDEGKKRVAMEANREIFEALDGEPL